MFETHPLIKKLNFKDHGQPVLILSAPKAYDDVLAAFNGEIHKKPANEKYEFVQVFGATNEELQSQAKQVASLVAEEGLFWLCYPKKTSKLYKGSDCSRDTVMVMLSEEGFEPVRQVAIDEDWSALRFKNPSKIKKMTRKFAVTEVGKQRTE